MIKYLIFLFSLFSISLEAATVERLGPGLWTNTSQWYIGGSACGCIPSATDDVIINTTSVILNINTTVESIYVQTGNLVVGVGITLTLSGYDSPLIVDDQLLNDGTINLSSSNSSNPAIIINGTLTNQGSLDAGNNPSGRGVKIDGTVTNTGLIKVGSTGSEGIFIENIGTLDNDNIIDLTSLNTLTSIDILGVLDNSATIIIDSSSHYGVHLHTIGTWTHTGSIDVSHCDNDAIYIEGNFTNNGQIKIFETADDGLYVVNSGYINNNGILRVHGPVGNYGIYNAGVIDNLGDIKIDSTLSVALYNAGISTFNNDNRIEIGGYIIGKGIWNLGTMINNDSIILTQSTTEALMSNGQFTNNGTINTQGSHDDLIRNHGTFTNLGVLDLKNAADKAIFNSVGGIFDNQALLLIDNSNNKGISNSNTFSNTGCGVIDIKSKITSIGSSSFDNQTYIFSSSTIPHSTTSNFVNNGIIKEKGSGFLSTSMTNNGYLVLEIPGAHCEGDIVTNVFGGTGVNANYIAPVSSTDTHSDIVGSYNSATNELTLQSGSHGLTRLYFQFNQGSCTKSIGIDFAEVIRREWYADTDQDGFGDPANILCATLQPPGYILDNTDCDGTDELIYPGAPERCNGLDDDCNGVPESLVNVWTGSGDGITWGDADNWSESYTPLPCQEVIIDLPGTVVTLTSGDTTKIQKLLINALSITMTLESSSMMTVENKGIISYGKIVNDGELHVLNSNNSGIEIYDQFNNNGTLEIQNTTDRAIWITSSKKLINDGDINIQGSLFNSAIYNEGEITNQSNGNIHIFNNSSTVKCIEMASGALLAKLENQGIIFLENGSHGIYHFDSNSSLINALSGDLTIRNMSESGITNGTFDNLGKISISDISKIGLENVDNSSNGGSITIGEVDSLAIDIQGTFTNQDSILISNVKDGIQISGVEYSNQGVTIINESLNNGVIISTGAKLANLASLTIVNTDSTAIECAGYIVNNGIMEIVGTGKKGINAGIDIMNTGPASIIIKETMSTGLDLNTSSFLNQGTMLFSNIQSDAIDLDNASGSINFGTISFQEGITGFNINGTSTLINEATGILEGTGKMAANRLNNLGTISPGPIVGQFDMVNTYDHVNGTFNVDLEGYTGSGLPFGHDAIISSSPTLLGGILNVSLSATFEPVPGDIFTVVNTASRVGTFSTVNLVPNYCMVAEYTPNAVNITMPGLPTGTWNGTFNSDWFDYRNWNEGCVPGPNTDVTIVVSTSMPEIGFNKIARVHSIELMSSSTLKIIDGSRLEVIN